MSHFVDVKCPPVHCSFSQRLLQSFMFLFAVYYQTRANAFRPPTFLMIKNAPVNYASSQRFLQSVIGFFILFKCATMHYTCSKHLFTILVYSSLSKNTYYFKMYAIKVYCNHLYSTLLLLNVHHLNTYTLTDNDFT